MYPLNSLKPLAFLAGLYLIHLPAFSQCGTEPVSGTVTLSTSEMVNSYYPGSDNPAAGTYAIKVGSRDTRGNSQVLASGDLIVIMQMQGAAINTTNTTSYGDGVNGGEATGALNDANLVAGYYEYATIASISGSNVTLMYALANSYYNRNYSKSSSLSIRRFQVIRVPRYYNLIINSAANVTAPAWNGATGGVVVLDATNILTLNGTVNVSALGFRGGGGKQFRGASDGNSNGSTTLSNTDYRWESPLVNSNNKTGGAKGEGIAGSPVYSYITGNTTTLTATVEGYLGGALGRGAPGNAGGGGTDGSPIGSNENQYNPGGGGGGNGGTGGRGGSGWHGGSGNLNTYTTGGFGGSPFAKNSLQRIVMGGGGGAGSANNSSAANEVNASGGQGGGIIVIRAASYAGTGSVLADGGDAPGMDKVYTPVQTDAAGGAGAGGSIVIVTVVAGPPGLSGISASAKGGRGGDVATYHDHGPGGGGGGGMIYTTGTLASTNVNGGGHGFTRTGSSTGALNNTYGSTDGTNGSLLTLAAPQILTNGFGLSHLCGVLPANVQSFRAQIAGKTVDLLWQEESGLDYSRIEVEHSSNGNKFVRIGTIAFKKQVSSYSFNHANALPGNNFYRLKKMELEGKVTYSQTIQAILHNMVPGKFSLYPNPIDANTNLLFTALNKQQVTIAVLEHTGRRMYSKSHPAEKGNNSISLAELNGLKNGIYVLQLEVDGKVITDKVVK